jgi:hypothetical protein
MKHPSDRKGRAIIPESEKIKLKKIRENLKLNNEDIELLEAQIFEEQKEMLHALYPEESIADIVTGTVALGGIGGFFLGGIGSIFFPPLGALVFPSFGAIMVGYILGSNGQEKQRIYRQSILHKADEHRKAWGTVLVELKLIPNE